MQKGKAGEERHQGEAEEAGEGEGRELTLIF